MSFVRVSRAAIRVGGAYMRRPQVRPSAVGSQTWTQGFSRAKSSTSDYDTTLFIPVPIKTVNHADDINVGFELTGEPLEKSEVLKALNRFYKRKEIQTLGAENGLDNHLFHQGFLSFRKWIVESDVLPPEVHITLSDILRGSGHVDDIFPYFMQHCKQIFPMLDCMEDLRKISDSRDPASWYPEARAIHRTIVFHAGPTNSGKTYHALERFSQAKSGIYCGPLKLLASEVHQKTNEKGVPCDLVTGEERVYAREDGQPSSHVSCTVEMTNIHQPYEVAVVDEIQMIKDPQRGWAWTRALLGLCAEEIHLCGEPAAIDLVTEMMLSTGEEVEVRRYKRLTGLTYLKEPLGSLNNLRPGDAIVCFSKADIFQLSRQIEAMEKECAVIYGSLPPGTKLAQARKFNDPKDPCKILVATDAIGMGINLSIKRVIFNSLIKPTLNEKGEKEMDNLSTSQALQIAGRAGRFGTHFQDGEVTTMHKEDLQTLHDIIKQPVEPIEAAGLHPTAEQVEMFAYQLPDASMSNLIDIFINLAQVDSRYFVCNIEDFKFLADMIQHIPLNLRARYVFCCAPINKKQPFLCTSFLKFARQFSRGEPITFDWVCRLIGWPVAMPRTIRELMYLESIHDVLDVYLWLSYRFMDMFPDGGLIRMIQRELDLLIQESVYKITRLIRQSESQTSSGTSVSEDEIPRRRPKGHMSGLPKFDEMVEEVKVSPAKHGATSIPKSRQGKEYDSETEVGSKHRLSDKLVQEGVITQSMLDKLRKEWERQAGAPVKGHYADSDGNMNNKTRKKRGGRKNKH
ncbi:ATP-dependent RNA helicase supv3l1, mitochondrial [Branchiostoma belcheri]|nr:ATP-dependent RNA helicase supv3l1, mitochondrial [Branchiostoma belcheri]